MEDNINIGNLTKERLAEILLDAYNTGNNNKDITLRCMLDLLEKRLKNQ